MSSVLPYLLVGLGGFMGANARFILARWTGAVVETRFPLGTFLINISGSFFLGVVGTIVSERMVPNSDTVRLALGIGFLGPTRRSPRLNAKRTHSSKTVPGSRRSPTCSSACFSGWWPFAQAS
jgi:hypothetical protein